MKIRHLFTICFVIILQAAMVAQPADDPVIEKGTGGHINWLDQEIVINGYAQVNAGTYSIQECRDKTVKAVFKNTFDTYIDIVSSLRVVNDKTIQDMLLEDKSFITELKDVFFAGQVDLLNVYKNGSSTMVYRVPLFGETGLSKALFFRLYPPDSQRKAVFTRRFLSPTENVTIPVSIGYTGLIIDGRNLGVNPCFSPKVFDEKNGIVVDMAVADFQAALQRGLGLYTHTLSESRKKTRRVGNRPLIINAIRASGAFKTNLTILNSDANRLQLANEPIRFLEQCKVIIII